MCLLYCAAQHFPGSARQGKKRRASVVRAVWAPAFQQAVMGEPNARSKVEVHVQISRHCSATHHLTVVLALVPLTANAQQTSQASTAMPGMNHGQSEMISGKDHPELIPDLTAYHLYFITVGELPNPSANRLARQKAYLAKMPGMRQEDSQTIAKIIGAYKLQWTAMVNDYNARVDGAVRIKAPLPDSAAFLRQRDQLVQQYVDTLRKALSPEGMAQFEAHIQSEKVHITISAPEEQ